ncbi:hypothetical protein R3P38DRAFT_3519319 [Favolaschia claudopus]|uniref:Uncharacterized protein n=1 Tax=Favolaschia claudopus TaxID=2862362 RepID=A0AAV9YYZ5_9AGAR
MPSKFRAVSTPDREYVDTVFQAARDAQQANVALTADIHALRTSLAATQATMNQQVEVVRALQDELARKSHLIADMQQHEGQMEAQFLADQGKLDSMLSQYGGLVTQVTESQKLLMQRNEEVARLQAELTEKMDESIRLRAQNQIHVQVPKAPQIQTPPHRGRRANMAPVDFDSGTRTVEIPLDPIPMPEAKPKSKRRASVAPTPLLAEMLGTDVDTLGGLVDQFNELLQGGNTSVDIDDSDDEEKKTQKTKEKKLRTALNRILRNATYAIFGVAQADDFGLHIPASKDVVAACERGVDPPEDSSQWDYGPGYTRSRLNDLMINKVVDHAIATDGPQGKITKNRVDRDFLVGLMYDKMKAYRGIWKKMQPQFNEETEHMETPQEARMRGAQQIQQHQLDTKSTSAKRRKYDDRHGTAVKTIDIKVLGGRSGDVATWKRLLQMIQLLGVAGMSSEEEDELIVGDLPSKLYRIKLYSTWSKGRRKDQGSRERPGVAPAPRGLPKSLFNSEWLAKVTPGYMKELNISKKAFELFVAATDRM